jgi:hypothetical protein
VQPAHPAGKQEPAAHATGTALPGTRGWLSGQHAADDSFQGFQGATVIPLSSDSAVVRAFCDNACQKGVVGLLVGLGLDQSIQAKYDAARRHSPLTGSIRAVAMAAARLLRQVGRTNGPVRSFSLSQVREVALRAAARAGVSVPPAQFDVSPHVVFTASLWRYRKWKGAFWTQRGQSRLAFRCRRFLNTDPR